MGFRKKRAKLLKEIAGEVERNMRKGRGWLIEGIRDPLTQGKTRLRAQDGSRDISDLLFDGFYLRILGGTWLEKFCRKK